MAVATMTRCDCDCGASTDAPGEQGWWLVQLGVGVFRVDPMWNDAVAHSEWLGWKHAAGSKCVHRLLNQWFEKQREGK